MKIIKFLFYGIGLATFLLLLLCFRPINPFATIDDCVMIKGKVNHIFEAGVKDICFRIKDKPQNVYYINRGLESGLDLENLRQDLLNQDVELYYVKHWTPLDPKGQLSHIGKLTHNGEIVFDELY